MKKFFTLICLLAVFGTAFAGNVPFTVKVDDASHIVATINGNVVPLQNGVNTVNQPEYENMVVTPVAPYVLKAVYNGEAETVAMTIESDGTVRCFTYEDAYYAIYTGTADEVKKATATVTVDDASKVNFKFDSGRVVWLEDGTQTIEFNPDTESAVTLTSTTYGVPVYKVELNGIEVEPGDDYSKSHHITLTDGCTLNITAAMPAVDATVTFNYADETSKGSLAHVYLDGTEVTDFNGESLNAKTGQLLYIYSNTDDFQSVALTYNGQTSYNTSNQYVITGDMTIDVEAKPVPKYKVTVNVDNPDAVKFGVSGISFVSAKIATLVAGDNTVEVNSTNPYVCWEPAGTNYKITSVTIDGEDCTEYTYYWVEGNSVVTIKTEEVVPDSFVLWINGKAAPEASFELETNNYQKFEVNEGYNFIEFSDDMLPLGLSWEFNFTQNEDDFVNKVYINGEQISGRYKGATAYDLPVKKGDVVKVFIASEPVDCKVEFSVAEDVAVSNATTDHVTPVEDLTQPLNVFGGTHVAFTAAMLTRDNNTVEVKVNDKGIEPDNEGVYSFVADGDTKVDVTKKATSAISDINAATGRANVVYDLQGRRVNRAAKGLYIIDGQKTLVK